MSGEMQIKYESNFEDKGEFDTGYRAMAQDVERDTDAVEFSEATIGDVGDDAR